MSKRSAAYIPVNTRRPIAVLSCEAQDVGSAVGFPNKELRAMTAGAAAVASPDAVLVDAARAGDREAFARLYVSHTRLVHGVLLSRVPRDEVDDLLQDVFLLAFRKLHTLRDPAAFGPWLAMIARNRAHDYYRHTPDTAELSDDVRAADPTAAEAAAILELIQTLPVAYRETLVLRLVEGMTGPEIASHTGLTAASVRVNLHRGMKQLREKLGGVRHA